MGRIVTPKEAIMVLYRLVRYIIDYAFHLVTLSLLRSHQDDNKGSLPPGNMGLPIIGETVAFLRHGETGEFFTERYAKYGSVFRTNFLGMNNIHIREMAHVKKILSGEHRLITVHWPPAMRYLLGAGALATSADLCHRRLRKCIRPFMNGDAVTRFTSVMVRCIADELDKWVNQSVIDLYNCAKNLTMKCACAVLIGGNGLDDDVVKQLSSDFITLGDGFFQLPLSIPGTKYYKARRAKARILKTVEHLCVQNAGIASILRHMFEARSDEFQSKAERDNLMVECLFGAQETTACTITCVMTLLDQHPQELGKLRSELCRFDPTMNTDLRSLTYLSNVIKETLRLFPPIGGGFRKVLTPFVLGDYTIPKDWTITYSIHDMHDDSGIDDVTEFIPERWGSESSTTRVSDFLPFGAGPRSCVGKDYALLFIKLTIILLVRTYSWKLLTPNPKFTRVPIVKPEQTILVKMTNFSQI